MNRLPLQSIRFNFLLIHSLAIFVIIFVVGALFLHIAMNNYIAQVEQRISHRAQAVVSDISIAVKNEDWQATEQELSALRTEEAIFKTSILLLPSRSEHTFEIQMYLEEHRHFLWLFEWVYVNTGTLEIPIVDSEKVFAHLRIYYSTDEIYNTFIEYLFALLLITLTILTVAVLAILKIQRLLFTPVDRLLVIVREVIASKIFSSKLSKINGGEFEQLISNAYPMATNLTKRDIQLRHEIKEKIEEIELRNSESEKAFIHAPLATALVNEKQSLFRLNKSLKTTLSVENSDCLLINQFISEKDYSKINNFFKLLVKGNIASFEYNADCHDMEGKWLAAILNFSAVRNDKNVFSYAILQLQNITEAKKLSIELEFQARHDALTKLPNRRVLKDALNAISDNVEPPQFALAILDLDQFKLVNDTAGHSAGDELLCQVSSLIKRFVRSNDLVIRLGGDEFAILLTNCGRRDAKNIAESIRDAIDRWEYRYAETVFRISVSIGVVVVDKLNIEASELMNQADAACFVAKDLGRNRVHLIDDGNKPQFENQGDLGWVQRIHHALENDNIELFSQSIIQLDASDNHKRQEVLLRIKDKTTHQVIPPGAFLPSAERYGLTEKIDLFVVKKLISTLNHNKQLFDSGQKYWVNVSSYSLSSKSFLQELQTLISTSRLPDGTVNFEVKETAVIRNIEATKRFLDIIHSMHCLFALDNFGSGGASFNYLKNLPVDFIKIDGTFIRNIVKNKVDMLYVKSIVDIAEVMNIQVIAEYVESQSIRKALFELGVSFGQGYALDEPAPLVQ